MKSLIAFFSFSVLALVLFSCGTSNTVKVNSFTPTGEVEKLTNFVIEFSEDLAPPDQQDKWLDDEFVTFTPPVAGKFKWTNASTLVFSPDVPLEPLQSYSAKINQKVLFNTKYSPDFDEYDFHTPYFDATKADFFWTNIPHQSYKLSVQANLHFNYPVDPSGLKKYLEVKRAGNVIENFTIVTDKSADVIAINFGEIDQTDKKQEFSITVKKDLQSVLGKMGLAEDRTFESTLPPIIKLAITNVSSGFDGNTGWIEVSTTQTVDKDKLEKYVETDPKKDLTFFVNDNSFRIETDLNNVQTVDLFIKKGLPGLYGGELEFDYEQTVAMVNVNPSINFTDKKGKYLMLGGEQNLEVNAVNISKAEIEVSRVFKNNLLHFLNRYSYSYYDDYYYGYTPDYNVGDFGKSIYTEKKKFNAGKNWLNKFTVNLSKAIDSKYKGIYVVAVRSEDDRWINDSKMVALSDLGIITKMADDEIIVFVNSIATTEPVAGVDVTVISSNNQTLLSGKTGDDGVIKFTDVKKKTEGFYSRLVTAEKENDFNYIDLHATMIETSRFDVGGITQYAADFNTFLYMPRNIYRPGDQVDLSGIIRNDKIKNVKDIPVLVKIITPTGKTFDEYKKDLNAEGSFEISFQLPQYAQTGGYVAQVYTGSKQLIGTYNFSCEEFVPDKIRVTLNSDKNKTEPGDHVSISVDAEFLFGAKAAGLKWETDIQLIHKLYYSDKYSDYDFSQSSIKNPTIDNTMLDGMLDANGHTSIEYDIPKDIVSGGVIMGTAYVSVFDLTGRTITRSVSFNIFPKNYFIGIKAPGYYFGTNEKLNFQLVTVDPDDKMINNFNTTAKLIRYEWQTVLKSDNYGKYYYASEQKPVDEWERNIDINGPTPFSFVVSKSGKYELRISKRGSSDYQSKTFYAYGWGSSTASSFQVDKEGRVEIVFDKKEYEPGRKSKNSFHMSFLR